MNLPKEFDFVGHTNPLTAGQHYHAQYDDGVYMVSLEESSWCYSIRQMWDGVSSGKFKIVKRSDDSIEFCDEDLVVKPKYNESIMRILRREACLASDDTSQDHVFSRLTKDQVLSRVCSYYEISVDPWTIKDLIEGIYGVTLR